jgi:hypothetical protein
VTDQCHPATALLTREYQVDHRRQSLTPTASRATTLEASAALPEESPLDNYFHISTETPTRSRFRWSCHLDHRLDGQVERSRDEAGPFSLLGERSGLCFVARLGLKFESEQ